MTTKLRHIIQLGAFFLFPGLFLTIFNSIRDLVVSFISGSFSLAGSAPSLIIVIAVFAITALWGRFFCGYLCSFGAVQELLAYASRKIQPQNRKIPDKTDHILKYLKYVILFSIVFMVWVLQLPVDSSLSPWGVFGMLVSGNLSVMRAAIPTIGFVLLAAILTFSFFVERSFCRYMCPLGAMFTPISSKRLFRIKRNESSCNGCENCSHSCAMGIKVHDRQLITDGECIDCMRCIEKCGPNALCANPNPAIAGTASALIMCGVVSTADLISEGNSSTVYAAVASGESRQTISSSGSIRDNAPANEENTSGEYADGVYTGTGSGLRGTIKTQVTVEGGRITDITILSYKDDEEYFRKAKTSVINAIINEQTPDVSAVSGATFSSQGIMESVADALKLEEVKEAVTSEPPQNGHSNKNNSSQRDNNENSRKNKGQNKYRSTQDNRKKSDMPNKERGGIHNEDKL